jgi:5-methylcytosine-specific restriction endonuclease McrA
VKRTGRLPFRSRKQQALYRQRGPFVAAMLAEHPYCQIRWDAGCGGLAVDVDEILSRAQGGSILDPANCQTACSYCHRMKHLNPAEAVRRGVTRMRRAAS